MPDPKEPEEKEPVREPNDPPPIEEPVQLCLPFKEYQW